MATNMTLGDLTSPVNATMDPGDSRVAAMAGTMQDLQQKQVQTQQMQQQLDGMKWESNKGMLNTYMNASPGVRKSMKKQISGRLQQNGADPTILNSLDDEDMEQNARVAMNAYGSDPQAAAAGQAMLAHVSIFEPTIQGLAESAKKRSDLMASQAMKEAALANARTIAQGHDQTKLEATSMLGGIRLDRNESNAVSSLTNDPEVVQQQKSVQQAKKDYDLIQQSRGPDGLNPLKAHELVQSYVGLLKNQAASSVGGERESLENAATDLETRGNSWLQKLNPKGMIHYSDEPFLHDMEESIRGVHGTIKDNLNQRLNEKLRTSGLPSVNNAQQAAYNQIMQGSELGYKPTNKSTQNTPSAPPPVAAPGAGTQTTPPPLTANQQSYIANLQKAGLSPQDALARMQAKKVQ